MKRFFTILCLMICVIPLFAFPTSAGSYDLGQPYSFMYITPTTANPSSFPYGSIYRYLSDTDEVIFGVQSFGRSSFGYNLDYYSDFTLRENWEFLFGDFIRVSDVGRNIIVSGFDRTEPVLYYANTGPVDNSLFFPAFVYENLLLPVNGQYMRVSFSFSSALISAPSKILEVFDVNDLCFLCDTSGVAGVGGRYSYPKVLAQTATVSKSGNIYTYTFYFNLNTENLEPLLDSDNVCLAVRVPYYFNDAEGFSEGIYIVSNAEIPSTYEILTIGGYDQELNEITNSLNTVVTTLENGNKELLDYYQNADEGDTIVINAAKNQFDQGKDVVNDYNDANDKIQDIISGAVVPDVNEVINDQVDMNIDTLDPIKDLFQNTFIVSAFLICFAFCLISVLLYGIRG